MSLFKPGDPSLSSTPCGEVAEEVPPGLRGDRLDARPGGGADDLEDGLQLRLVEVVLRSALRK